APRPRARDPGTGPGAGGPAGGLRREGGDRGAGPEAPAALPGKASDMSGLGLGVTLPVSASGRGPSGVVGTACLVEQAELDAVSVPDVLVGVGTPALEAVALLAAAVAATVRVLLVFVVRSLYARSI